MAAASERKEPMYTDAPAPDISKLSSTRFIEGEKRRYPYRDALGRVNLNLVNSSLAEAEVDSACTATLSRLQAWQRHAIRALERRPDDEKLTLDALVERRSPTKPAKAACMPTTVVQPVAMRRRLFSAPRDGDEPARVTELEDADDDCEWRYSGNVPAEDRLYLERLAEEAEMRRSSRKQAKRVHATRGGGAALVAAASASTSADDDADENDADSNDSDEQLFEVEALLEEDELGGKGFLIRWAGFGPEHDTWEPEWNIAPRLVEAFRGERDSYRRHAHDDFCLGRKRLLWCSTCCRHLASDSFSALQRKAEPRKRACLIHFYKTEGRSPAKSPAASMAVAVAVAPPVPPAAGATPARTPGSATPARPTAALKRPRDLPPPAPPTKAPRPIARALSHRQAAIEMRTMRGFGFGAR